MVVPDARFDHIRRISFDVEVAVDAGG